MSLNCIHIDMSNFDWSALGWVSTIIGLVVGYIFKVKEHTRLTVFDHVLSKQNEQLDKFLNAAFCMKRNIIELQYGKLSYSDGKYLDERLTSPLILLEKESFLTAIFFPKNQRGPFRSIVDAAREFNAHVSMSLSLRLDDVEKINKCDTARSEFNRRYDAAMESLTDILYREIYKEWRINTQPRWKSVLSLSRWRYMQSRQSQK